ncbi:MAG: sigma-70 family RNA polymerase sigma factor [Burkholderiaceae bacterium]
MHIPPPAAEVSACQNAPETALDVPISDDPREFAARVRLVQRRLFGFLGRMGLDAAMVDELAQETLLRAWQARERFDPARGRFITWLLTIARRIAIDAVRHERARIPSSEPEHDPDQQAAPERDGPHDTLVRSRQRAALLAALAALNEPERAVIALAYVEGLSAAAAGEVLGCSAGAFRTRLTRARAHLAHALATLEAS